MPKRSTKEETSDKRNIVKLPLTPGANRLVNEWCEKTGGSKATFVQRLIEWYASAPPSMQAIVFNQVPEDMVEQFAERSAAYFDKMIKGVNPPQPKESEQVAPRFRESKPAALIHNGKIHQLD